MCFTWICCYLGQNVECIKKKQEPFCMKAIILTWSRCVQNTSELHAVCDAVSTLWREESTQSAQSVRVVPVPQRSPDVTAPINGCGYFLYHLHFEQNNLSEVYSKVTLITLMPRPMPFSKRFYIIWLHLLHPNGIIASQWMIKEIPVKIKKKKDKSWLIFYGCVLKLNLWLKWWQAPMNEAFAWLL